jgi:hypothetical protein
MRRITLAFGLIACVACAPGGGDGGQAGSGGGAAGSGGPGVAGSAGGQAGAAGSGPGAAGTAGGQGGSAGSGTAGSATGVAGGPAGAGGSATGVAGGPAGAGGRGGATAGAGGRGGATAGAGGRGGGAAGTGVGGAGGTGVGGAAGAGDAFVSNVMITVHTQTRTILNVAWTQLMAAESTRLEFTFPNGPVLTSRPKAGATGAHTDVVLGVPASTNVTVRIISRQGGIDYKTRDYTAMTGALPTGLPVPMLLSYNAALASPDRWMFGGVEDSTGGCTNGNCYYNGTFWLYIMDRQGRIVWYYADAANNAASSFQRIAKDGEYIWVEKSRTGTRGVYKMTLDRVYNEWIPIAGLADAIDVTDDGSLLYDANNELHERTRAGTDRVIWRCRDTFPSPFQCYSNTVNYDAASNTVMMSFPEPNTVIQINRATGAVVATYGDYMNSYTFMPTTWSFEFQHFPNITKDGTLIVSTHLSAYPHRSPAGPMHHAFVEFDIDRTNRRLVERWSYTLGTEWTWAKGMAIKLPNNNVLGNYGTGGAIREITPDKQTVFHVKFDVPTGDDYFNKMVGHNVLINDLYALNGGGPR